MNARHVAAFGIFALCTLAIVWQGIWHPPTHVPRWLAATLQLSPMLPGAYLATRGKNSAPLLGSLGALILFSHGVMEAWASESARIPALIEIVLALVVIISASWNGFQKKFGRKHSV